MLVRQDLEAFVLGPQPFGPGVEALGILGRPPVLQDPVAVGLAALVVEAVADLVADDAADAAIVHRHVRLRVEEGRLQDGGGEDDLVQGGVVIGIHGLGRHAPFAAVHRLVHPGHVPVPVRHLGAEHRAIEVIGLHHHGGIVAEMVRIADLHGELGELGLGRGLGLGAHPVQLVDPGGQGCADIGHQLQHLGLGFGREVLLHIDLADRLAQRSVGGGHGALPAGTLLGLAAQGLGAELELGVDKGLGQIGGRGIGHAEGHPRLQGLQRGLGKDRGLLREGGVVGQDDPVHRAEVTGHQQALEVEARRIGRQFVRGHGVVGLVAVAALGPLPGGFGHAGLEGDHVLGPGLGIGPAGKGQHLGDIGLVLGLGRGKGGLQIVVLVRQAGAAAARLHRIVGRVLGVRADIDAEQAAVQAGMIAHQGDQVLLRRRRLDPGEVRGDRGRAELFHPVRIHEGLVEGPDLGGLGRGGAGRILENAADPVFRQDRQLVEIAEAGAVGGDFRLRQIGPVGKGEEVVPGLHRSVAPGQVEAPGPVVRAGRVERWSRNIGGLHRPRDRQSGSRSRQPDRAFHGLNCPLHTPSAEKITAEPNEAGTLKPAYRARQGAERDPS